MYGSVVNFTIKENHQSASCNDPNKTEAAQHSPFVPRKWKNQSRKNQSWKNHRTAPGSLLARGRAECVVGKTKPRRRTKCGTGFWQNETNVSACATSTRASAPRHLATIRSPHNDPALDAGAQRADPLDVLDHFARNWRRIGVGGRGRCLRQHGVAVAAASHEIVGGDAVGARLVDRRIANFDRGDAAAGWPFEIG